MEIGLERIEDDFSLLDGCDNIGVLCNHSSVTRKYRHILDIVANKAGNRLKGIFSPQHGLYSTLQDNMIESHHENHPITKVPVHSLYSETRIPTEEMLKGIDTILIDLPITGCRVYTYKYTVAACLRAAKKYGKKIILLDRPNPIGLETIEGNILEGSFSSFVGEFPIPLRHGLTMGELARFFNNDIKADLKVIELSGYDPSHYWQHLKRDWLFTSPNLPTADSVYVFPGTVMMEGTNLSEGRGTTMPFQLIGAPYIQNEFKFCEKLVNNYGLSEEEGGLFFRPIRFQPSFQKWANKECKGCFIHILDVKKIATFKLGLAIIKTALEENPKEFKFRPPGYEYNFTQLPIHLILGTANTDDLLNRNKKSQESFKSSMSSYLEKVENIKLYPRKQKVLSPFI